MNRKKLPSTTLILMIALLLNACGTANSPSSPTVPPPTATYTPTLPPEPTSTPEPIPTTQPTDTPLPVLTETEATQEIWSIDFESGEAEVREKFNGSGSEHYAEDENSFWEIVPDPTGSGKGFVLRAIAKGPPPNIEATAFGESHRAYPDIYQWDHGLIEGDVAVELDLNMMTENSNFGHWDPAWLNVLSIFSEIDNTVDWATGVSIAYNQSEGGFRAWVQSHNGGEFLTGEDSPVIPENSWVRLRLEIVESTRECRLYLKTDEQQEFHLVSKVKLGDGIIAGINGMHAGLYGGADFRGTVLNDNMSILVQP